MPFAAVGGAIAAGAASAAGAGAIGAAAAGALASTAIGAGVSALGAHKSGSDQSSAISTGQQQAIGAVQPWVTSGVAANKQQSDLLGLNGPDASKAAFGSFSASPGYQYQVDQAIRGVDAGAAARGTLVSGSTIKGEETQASNLANLDFGNYMSRLNSLSTLGQASGINQAGTDTGAATNQATIAGNRDNGITNSLSSFAGNKDVQNGLTGLFTNGGGSSSGASPAFGSGQGYTSSAFGNTAANGLQVGGV